VDYPDRDENDRIRNLAAWCRRHPALAQRLDVHACRQLAETEAALDRLSAEASLLEPATSAIGPFPTR
jgi:hypothetical protein